jgi:ribosomal protein S18 acetylase RimI-like enzyme
MISTRTATLADLDTLLAFEQGIITTERPFDQTLDDDPISYYDIGAMITAPNIEVVVATIENEIIGSGYARVEDAKPYLKHQKYAYLGFMYVKPEYRGKGINQKVIKHLQQWCILRDITECRLEVYHDNLPAIKAYEKLGFEKLLITMRTKIEPDVLE